MKSENSIENEVYDLMVDRDFELLTSQEQSKVLELMTAEEFSFRREIVMMSSSVFEDEENLEPAPLILPNSKVSFLTRSVPIYQLFITVAALILLFLLVVPFFKADSLQNTQTEYITKVDTVFVDKLEYDTIVKIKEKPIYLETIKYVSLPDNNVKEEPRFLKVNNLLPPNLDENSLKNSGLNMKSDPTSVLIRDYQLLSEN